MSESFYPPNPASVPPNITRVETRFRIRATAVVIGIFLFLYPLLVTKCTHADNPSQINSTLKANIPAFTKTV